MRTRLRRRMLFRAPVVGISGAANIRCRPKPANGWRFHDEYSPPCDRIGAIGAGRSAIGALDPSLRPGSLSMIRRICSGTTRKPDVASGCSASSSNRHPRALWMPLFRTARTHRPSRFRCMRYRASFAFCHVEYTSGQLRQFWSAPSRRTSRPLSHCTPKPQRVWECGTSCAPLQKPVAGANRAAATRQEWAVRTASRTWPRGRRRQGRVGEPGMRTFVTSDFAEEDFYRRRHG